MITVAVIGAKGRMGAAVCTAVEAAPDMELAARLDMGDAVGPDTLAGAQVAVDFTVPDVTEANVHALLDAGVAAVVGTTGWTEESVGRVRDHAERVGGHVLIVPNFSLSAVLVMRFAALAAPYFESVEIIEMHHPNKVDAPSGTAVHTASGIAKARAAAGCAPVPDATTSDPQGARGARIDGIPVHAVRLRGLTAHEEVLLGNPGEQMLIRTDCFDRESFMPGVLLGVRSVGRRPGLTVGLDAVMDL
ncbi:4-hydroxy-tetrahydrodipicolinate reductase [Schaalia sp. 19OD2882]|uniref:4-hydroxy-tetrahydrodipicolinate reductase n=1 Tax=Schaalia sp. 19OD2882 TaxID=2794089 RepID=UPI001C1EED82|nr:4-hydroxy-tetrahydrodipicolinate reductase [Schaalia sp. 19OD2882]QWW18982.1 4-hydroxy-tetrahydrodipicolinate reductase [Schaalia sp. 19OD2882]